MLRFPLIVILLITISISSFGSTQVSDKNLTTKFDSPDFEQFFIKSANSPNYFVIHQEDLNFLKRYLDKFRSSADSLRKATRLTKATYTDSLKSSKLEVERINKILLSKTLAEQQKEASSETIQMSVLFSIAVLLFSSLFFGTKYFKIKIKYNSDLESLKEIENQFQVYKSSAIERERKYVREIIDLKTRLDC